MTDLLGFAAWAQDIAREYAASQPVTEEPDEPLR